MAERLSREIKREVLREVQKGMQGLNDRYVFAETLHEHIEALSPQWLKKYGKCFNRTRVEWIDEKGVAHTKGPWMYPLYEIKAMVINGEIKNLHMPVADNEEEEEE